MHTLSFIAGILRKPIVFRWFIPRHMAWVNQTKTILPALLRTGALSIVYKTCNQVNKNCIFKLYLFISIKGPMKKFTTLLIQVLVFFSAGFSQNLVPNPSMETASPCPNAAGQVNFATGWFVSMNSPDYYHSCGSGSYMTPGPNLGGTQVPFHGNAYAAGVIKHSSAYYREHQGILLTSPLVPGTTYRCRMWVSLCDISQWGANKIGFQFNTVNTSSVANNAHVFTNTVITDKTNWTLVQGTFVAAAAYTYVFVGNFFDEANTTLAAAGAGSYAGAYFYWDSISVAPITPLPIELVNLQAKCDKGVARIGWTTSSQTNNANFTIEKSEDGINYSEIGIIPGAGTSNEMLSYSFIDNDTRSSLAYYRLKQTDFNGACEYFEPITIQCENSDVSVVPNPNAGIFKVMGLNQNSKLYISESGGKIVYSTNSAYPNMEIDISNLSPGIYYLTAESGSETIVQKMIIQ